jgi:hypothetical protein
MYGIVARPHLAVVGVIVLLAIFWKTIIPSARVLIRSVLRSPKSHSHYVGHGQPRSSLARLFVPH